jgi:hypothetical protein
MHVVHPATPTISSLQMPSAKKTQPLTPLERLDHFIKEQRERREAFWARRKGRACQLDGTQTLASNANSKQKSLNKNEKAPAHLWNPRNCVECEELAMKAVQARIDAIHKLTQCCIKLDATLDTTMFISSRDPRVSVFFRCVANVRAKTIEAVERVASWERLVGRGRPFVYRYPFALRCLSYRGDWPRLS